MLMLSTLEGGIMEPKFVVIATNGLESILGPQFFATEEEATRELERVQRALKDPSDVILRRLVEVA